MTSTPKDTNKPRGFFTDESHLKWTKADPNESQTNTKNIVIWPLIKTVILVVLFALTQKLFGKTWVSILTCIMVLMYYPRVVALIVPNTIPMPAMD
jgi:hypothetical protein